MKKFLLLWLAVVPLSCLIYKKLPDPSYSRIYGRWQSFRVVGGFAGVSRADSNFILQLKPSGKFRSTVPGTHENKTGKYIIRNPASPLEQPSQLILVQKDSNDTLRRWRMEWRGKDTLLLAEPHPDGFTLFMRRLH